MSTKKLNQFIIVVPAVLCIALAGCRTAYTRHEVVAAGPVSEPLDVVESFYSSYASLLDNPMIDRTYRSDGRLTPEFIQKVDAVIASFDKGGYDPFLCAQDIPGEFAFDDALVSGEEATVVVHQVWNPGTEYEFVHDVTVALRRADDQWKINDVLCGGDEENDLGVEGWQVLTDEAYGFTLRFPGDWTYEEGQLLPPDERADGEKALQRVLFLQPQGWDGVAPPLHVQVTDGTQEELERLYVPPTYVEKLEVNGLAVIKEVEDIGGVQIIRYVFQSPTDETVRVVALDSISGFPERAEGNDEVMDTLRHIVQTITFIR